MLERPTDERQIHCVTSMQRILGTKSFAEAALVQFERHIDNVPITRMHLNVVAPRQKPGIRLNIFDQREHCLSRVRH